LLKDSDDFVGDDKLVDDTVDNDTSADVTPGGDVLDGLEDREDEIDSDGL
jgi:hypothetical protein